MKITTVLCDLDDTLIPNAYTYYIPQLDAIKLMCVDLLWNAPGPVAIIKRATELQLQEIKEEKKISKQCFSNSYVKVYQEICESVGKAPNTSIISAIVMATQKFFLKEYSIFPYVKETLSQIKQKKILLTRGDTDIQSYKIENTRLTSYFDAIEIVDLKNKETYLSIIEKYQLKPDECCMIGDSVLNDILPALDVGMQAFHVCNSKDDWETNHTNLSNDFKEHLNYVQINQFQEVLKYLD
jgi:putative hydrolase of the HAD superfamily